jgi:hypothetical protein
MSDDIRAFVAANEARLKSKDYERSYEDGKDRKNKQIPFTRRSPSDPEFDRLAA